MNNKESNNLISDKEDSMKKITFQINEFMSLNICITYKCMFKCKMCDMWKIKGLDELSFGDWKDFIRDFRSLTDKSFLINFAGGEPLMKEGILELVNFCATAKFETYIGTNAYLIDENFAKRIAGSGLSTIGLSLESLDENIHDSLRGVDGAYRRVMKAIDNLGRFPSNLRIVISTIILEQNLDSIIPLINWVNAHDRLNGINFQAIMQPFNTPLEIDWYKKEEYNFLWPRDPARVRSVIDELIKIKREGKCKVLNPLSQLYSFGSYFENPESNKNEKCKLAGNAIDIEPRGTVRLCFDMEAVGNIKDNNLEEILNSQRAIQVAEMMRNCTKNCHYLINCFYKDEGIAKEED